MLGRGGGGGGGRGGRGGDDARDRVAPSSVDDDGDTRARLDGLVELMRDVYEQEKRLAHARRRRRLQRDATEEAHGTPFQVDWVSAPAPAAAAAAAERE